MRRLKMKNKSIFITATGTDIGKTYISALLVKKMNELGLDCGYYKPVLSGAKRQADGSLVPGDCDFVLKTAGLNEKPTDCISYCFEEAVSPHLASIRSGVKIERDVILKDFLDKSNNHRYTVVEGAGGITCPLDLNGKILLLSDIIKLMNIDVIIVADGGLGTINSVLLTVEYAKSCNIGIKGIILNNYKNNNFMHIDNKNQIEILTKIPVIATVSNGDKDLNISKEDLVNIFRNSPRLV